MILLCLWGKPPIFQLDPCISGFLSLSMDIKNYLIKSSKAEYDERNCAELYVEHEHIEKDMKFNAHVKKRIIEE